MQFRHGNNNFGELDSHLVSCHCAIFINGNENIENYWLPSLDYPCSWCYSIKVIVKTLCDKWSIQRLPLRLQAEVIFDTALCLWKYGKFLDEQGCLQLVLLALQIMVLYFICPDYNFMYYWIEDLFLPKSKYKISKQINVGQVITFVESGLQSDIVHKIVRVNQW